MTDARFPRRPDQGAQRRSSGICASFQSFDRLSDPTPELCRCAPWSGLRKHAPKLPAHHRRTCNAGFTLLEIIAAMVLMTMLFAALTTLLRNFADQQRTLEKLSAAHPQTLHLEQLLRQDLINARFVQATSTKLVLVGNLAQDRTTGTSTGGRAEVTYLIAEIADAAWLVRREVLLDVLSCERSTEEPIWQDVGGFEFVGMDELRSDSNDVARLAPPGMNVMPVRSRLVIRDSDGNSLVQLNVVHHWESN